MSDDLHAPLPPVSADPRRREQNKKGNQALALGVLTLATWWLPVLGFLVGAAAIDRGLDARAEVQIGRADNERVARAAILLGVIGLVLSSVALVVFLVRSVQDEGINLFTVLRVAVLVAVVAYLFRRTRR